MKKPGSNFFAFSLNFLPQQRVLYGFFGVIFKMKFLSNMIPYDFVLKINFDRDLILKTTQEKSEHRENLVFKMKPLSNMIPFDFVLKINSWFYMVLLFLPAPESKRGLVGTCSPCVRSRRLRQCIGTSMRNGMSILPRAPSLISFALESVPTHVREREGQTTTQTCIQ